jgi:hypothetical protein
MLDNHPPREQPQGEQAKPESAVVLSQRLRREAGARLEAAQRSLDAVSHEYESVLDRRMKRDRRHEGNEAAGVASEGSVEDLFHGFLDTEPLVHWLTETQAVEQKGNLPNTP